MRDALPATVTTLKGFRGVAKGVTFTVSSHDDLKQYKALPNVYAISAAKPVADEPEPVAKPVRRRRRKDDNPVEPQGES